jgi:hypothetical protein
LDSWKTRGESIYFSESELLRDGITCMLDFAFYVACAAIRCNCTRPPPSSPRFALVLDSVLSLSIRTRPRCPADPTCLRRECTSLGIRNGLARTCTRPHPSEAAPQRSRSALPASSPI